MGSDELGSATVIAANIDCISAEYLVMRVGTRVGATKMNGSILAWRSSSVFLNATN